MYEYCDKCGAYTLQDGDGNCIPCKELEVLGDIYHDYAGMCDACDREMSQAEVARADALCSTMWFCDICREQYNVVVPDEG